MPEPSLADLLDRIEIKRVLVIDDQFTPRAQMYTTAFAEGSGPELKGLPPLPEGAAYEEHVARHWRAVPVAEKLRARTLAARAGSEPMDLDPTGMRALVGDREFEGLTLHEWNERREVELRKRARALILFDVNFRLETNDDEDEAGLVPAGNALNGDHDHIVGLLTTKAEEGDEEERAAGWAPRALVARSELVVVNKQLLVDLDDAERMAAGIEQIRATLQAAQLGRVRKLVERSLRDTLTAVEQTLKESSPTVLEDLVFRASRDGGEWEGDTWFRLYGTLGLQEARKQVALDPRARSAVIDVRELLHWRGEQPHDGSRDLAARVDAAECYEAREYVNGAGLPLANGDIFQKSEGGACYILVGQPCDLMLRPDGRAMKPATATMLPIKPTQDEIARSVYKLPEGGPFDDGEWEVRFRPEHHVAFDVLDLVSFNTDGYARLRSPHSAIDPLLPGLKKRHAEVEKQGDRIVALLTHINALVEEGRLNKQVATQMRKALLPAFGPFTPRFGEATTPFRYDCRRVGRLSGSYADALLVAHASARSRTAHAHELTRIVHDRGS